MCVSFLGDAYAGGGECCRVPMDSFATWNARDGAFRAMSCFSDNPELDELSEATETAGARGGGIGGGAMRVVAAELWRGR